MKLPALTSFFQSGGSFADFCQLHGLDQTSEVIEIHAKAPASADSELGFFPIEATVPQSLHRVFSWALAAARWAMVWPAT